MPSLPIITNAVRVTFRVGSGSGVQSINFGVVSSQSDLATLATTIDGQVQAGMWAAMVPQLAWNEMHLFRYDGLTPTFVRALTGAKWSGGAAAGDAVIAPSVLVSLRTAFRGQWARGRVYLPYISEQVVSGGILAGATQTTLQAAWDAFRTGMASAGCPMNVISLTTRPDALPPRVPAARQVISTTVENAMATQRRRQDRIAGR